MKQPVYEYLEALRASVNDLNSLASEGWVVVSASWVEAEDWKEVYEWYQQEGWNALLVREVPPKGAS